MTGGTIDSKFDPLTREVKPYSRSIIPNYVKRLKLPNKTTFMTICMKDSRDLNNDDLEKLTMEIEKSRSPYVIVTHGTYTIAQTAKKLEKNDALSAKTIMLVGAMKPLKSRGSDGGFNLRQAISKVCTLKPGIYILVKKKFLSKKEAGRLH